MKNAVFKYVLEVEGFGGFFLMHSLCSGCRLQLLLYLNSVWAWALSSMALCVNEVSQNGLSENTVLEYPKSHSLQSAM